MRFRSLAFRLVAGAAFWLAAGLAVGAFLLSMLFRDYVERSFDARLAIMLDGLVAASEIGADGAVKLTPPPSDERFGRPFSGLYWQIAVDDKPVLRSRSLWDAALQDGQTEGDDDSGPLRRSEQVLTGDQTVRVLSRTITLPGADTVFVYSVAGDRAEIVRETSAFNTTLAWSVAALMLVLVIAVFVQVRYGLRPLRRIPPALAAIRSGKERELAGDFPQEVEPMAKEINALLAHNREVVERARTHVGNLAHALKTPLAVLGNEAEFESGRLADTVKRQSEIMRRHAEHHLARARVAARADALGESTPVMPVVSDLKRTLEAIHAERAVPIALDCDAGAIFAGERQDLEEMLGNLMDNACKWAKGSVRVRVKRELDNLVMSVADDGPGLDAEARKAALERGERLDEAVPGSGLGLSIVRDLAALYDGELTLGESDIGGLLAKLTLPAAG